MSTPFVCAACRTRLRLPRLGQTRRLSQPTTHNHPTTFGNSIGGLQGQKSYESTAERVGNNASRGVSRGRYSGKELRPTELLSQLDEPWQLDDNGSPAAHSGPPRRLGSNHPQHMSNPLHAGYRRRSAVIQDRARTSDGQALLDLVQIVNDSVNAKDLPRAWAAFSMLAHDCSQPSLHQARDELRTKNLGSILHRLIFAFNGRWLRSLSTDTQDRALPTPVELYHAVYTVFAPPAMFYRPTIWKFAKILSELREGSLPKAKFAEALRQLIGMWRLCLLTSLRTVAMGLRKVSLDTVQPAKQVDISDNSDWSFLPTQNALIARLPQPHTDTTFEELLIELLSLSSNTMQTLRNQDWASAALLTVDMLRTIESADGASISPTNAPECAPFFNFLQALLDPIPAPRIPHTLEEILTTSTDLAASKACRAVVRRLQLNDPKGLSIKPESPSMAPEPQVMSPPPGDEMSLASNEMAETAASITKEGNSETRPSTFVYNFAVKPKDLAVEQFATSTMTKLSRAVQRHDMSFATKIRMHIFAFAGTQSSQTALPLELYEHLMSALLSLRNQKAAVDVWDHIIKAGYKPTVKTYAVMMRGARATKDSSGVEACWNSMRKAGLQPDAHAWSIRIHGLLSLKLVSLGLRALQEMGQEWLSAAKVKAVREMPAVEMTMFRSTADSASILLSKYPGDIGKVPRPDLVVMNTAISALAAYADTEVSKVLRWGRAFGVTPDVVTYNALLNISMRREKPGDAAKILRRMRDSGFEVNSTTWTVLLTALFQDGYLDGLSHVEQQEKILNFIKSLEVPSSGMSGLDDKGYALVIDRLLKNYNNPTGAAAVLAHMVETGRTITTHIYTILMSSYFSREPQPDLEAVATLWQQIQAENSGYGARVDNIFYDRMIEGYAMHHRLVGLQPALDFLEQMRKAGQRPGWLALECVARALVERTEWNRLRTLVDDVRSSLRNTRGAATQRSGQRKFWNFIIETGLLKAEGIVDVEHIMPQKPSQSPLAEAHA